MVLVEVMAERHCQVVVVQQRMTRILQQKTSLVAQQKMTRIAQLTTLDG